MHSAVLLLLLLFCLGANGDLSTPLVSAHMEDYIAQNQRQYDAKLKNWEDELALFRKTFTSELRAINVHADQLEVKLEEAKARLNPIELIDSWHKHCVQNYSATIPLIANVRSALNGCFNTANSNLNSILTNAQNSFNSLKNFYNSNLKTLLSDCEKRNPKSQMNYTICVENVISTTNTFTQNNQKNFNNYMQQAQCTADIRTTQAWECAFNTVYSTSSSLGTAIRLIDDCIANKLACASVSCTSSCTNQMIISWKENDFLNATIKNPFYGLDSKLSCLEMKFKY
ncbi:uncharacterized protein [Drosophila virilis]|uniref:Protein TsetseEP domain-containing protein n=1 Tax=Drosophila virilis TaxID=7244 RepID=B4MCN4_DROVI|nr:uncharacterized protein LOC6635363 [Drosophila virilis]EDW71422.1 uncharacterized protein Dvir_GJ19671 [Drosophila virilis]